MRCRLLLDKSKYYPSKTDKKCRNNDNPISITGIPIDRRADTAESRTCLRRPMMAMEAPCLPNCVDSSNPIPDPPPVTRATLPFNISALNGDSITVTLRPSLTARDQVRQQKGEG